MDCKLGAILAVDPSLACPLLLNQRAASGLGHSSPFAQQKAAGIYALRLTGFEN
jgi:hypothetical protein